MVNQVPIHDIDNNGEYPQGIVLDSVITDDYRYWDFFTNSHRVEDSGQAWIYKTDLYYSQIYSDEDDNHYLDSNLTLDSQERLLYYDDFERYVHPETTVPTAGILPDGWEKVQDNGTVTNDGHPSVSTLYRKKGKYSFRMVDMCVCALPYSIVANIIDLSEIKIEMYLRQQQSIYQLQVGVWDGTNFNLVQTINNASQDFEKVIVDFSNYNGPSGRIAFKNTLPSSSTWTYSLNYIDDLKITAPLYQNMGDHLGVHDEVPYYPISVDEVMNILDNGGQIRFAVLFNMYYKAYTDFGGRELTAKSGGLWEDAISWAIDNVSGYSPDPNLFPQDNGDYHPRNAINLPGMVFECRKNCRGSDYYDVKSLNSYDSYQMYSVNSDILDGILRGNHGCLNYIITVSSSDYIGDVMDRLTSYFDNERSYTSFRWPFDGTEDEEPDSGHMKSECINNRFWWDEESQEFIDTTSMDDEGDYIDTPNNYPIFVSVIDQPDEDWDYYNVVSDYESLEDVFGVELNDYVPMKIYKYWDDDNCRAFRPESVTIDIYIPNNGLLIYYDTVVMTENQHSLDANLWMTTIEVPCHYGSNDEVPITYYVVERRIVVSERLKDSIAPSIYPYDAPRYVDVWDTTPSTMYHETTVHNLVCGVPPMRWDTYEYNIKIIDEMQDKSSGSVMVTIRKEMCAINCSNCNSTFNGTIGGVSWHLDNYKDVWQGMVPLSNINTSMTFTESGDWHYITRHTDNYLEWTVINCRDAMPDNNCPGYPIDPSECGDIFYFEVDKSQYNWCNDSSIAGFFVKCHTNYDYYSLCYKIVYLDIDENPEDNWNVSSEDYIKFMLYGWHRLNMYSAYYQALRGELRYGTNKDGGFLDWRGAIVDFNQSDTTEDGNDRKVRIYICTTKKLGSWSNATQTLIGPFSIATLTHDKDNYYRISGDSSSEPKAFTPGGGESSNLPIRCGGWLGSLYGVKASDITDLKDPTENFLCYRTGGHQWYHTNILLPFARRKFRFSYFYRDKLHRQKLDRGNYTNSSGAIGAGGGPSQKIWERFCLFDSTDEIKHHKNEDYMMDYKVYYDSRSGCGTWGDIFDRMFYNMRSLFDASQLRIYKPHVDMQYHRTFMNTGIGWNGIGAKNPRRTVHNDSRDYLPYYDPDEPDTEYVFAPFKDMYRGCWHLNAIDNESALMIPNNPGDYPKNIGDSYYDSMFRDSGVSDIVGIALPFGSGYDCTPWGVCRGMFAGCRSLPGNLRQDLISKATNIKGHAFREMFRDAVCRFQTMPNSNQALNAFTFAMTYRRATYTSSYDPNMGPTYIIENILPRTQVWYGVYYRMFEDMGRAAGGVLNQRVEIFANSFNKWSFARMFKSNMAIHQIKVHHTNWYNSGDYKAHEDWVLDVLYRDSNEYIPSKFIKPSSLGKKFGVNRIPKPNGNKWIVESY